MTDKKKQQLVLIFKPRIPMFTSNLCCWYGVLLLVVFVSISCGAGTGTLFTDCGGIHEKTKGVIHTPNFPDAYPTPIYCEWLIHAAPEKKIILYFTQFYMKDSFYLTEYDYYQDTKTYIGRHDLGRISSWQHDLLLLAAYKPYVLIQFRVDSIGNRHLRVMDSLLDVYGFNITYEIVDRSTDVSKDTCSVNECSYLGNCIVSSDYSKFRCECFDGFFGSQCQYGPYCDPDNDPPINQCSNGGRCKYFFGSLINQCECLPGFYGAHCEIASGSEAELDQECKALKCSQLCDHIDGRAMCLCREGYKMDMDNGTCIPIARYRMDVTLQLASFVHVPDQNYEREIARAKQLIAAAIEENGVSTISKFGMKGLRNSTTTTLLDFYFYCKVSEVDQVDQALQAVAHLGTIGIFKLANGTAIYEKSPELHLSEVTNYDPNPALQGKLLTLVCAARGSAHMTFQWYKDGYKVETEITQRNAWETKIPHTIQGMQLSVLNIDNVSPFDAGTFTCEVRDFEDVQYKNVMVDVKGYPQVDLGPMSASILRGRQVSIKCISPDDSWQGFIYEWFKNGEKIDPQSREEYAEDMYPTGVRLVISAVTSYAEYTCRVTNEAGSANVTAYIYAIAENETELYCPRDYEGLVMWQMTSGGHFDIQRCPTEQGGYARRNCACEGGANRRSHCAWTKPNFAKCQSLFLIKIYDELEALRLGYQQTTLKKVFDKLYRYVLPSKSTILYSGDIDMVAGILKELLVHMKNFPQLVQMDDKISALQLVQLMSEIVTRLAAATDEEKERYFFLLFNKNICCDYSFEPSQKEFIEIQRDFRLTSRQDKLMLGGSNIIHMTNVLFTDAGRSLNFTKEDKLTSAAIDMQVDQYLEVPAPEEFKVIETKPAWTLAERSAAPYNRQIDVIVIRQKKLTDLLSYRNKEGPDKKVEGKSIYPVTVSAVHSLAPYVGPNTTYDTPFVEVRIHHTAKVNLDGLNTTVCLTWSADSSNQYKGLWTNNNCKPVHSSSSYTMCHCKIPAHIVAAIGKINASHEEMDLQYEELDIFLLAGYSVSMTIMLVTLYVYLRICGQLQRKLYSTHLSFIFCLFVSNVLVLLCIIKVKINIDITALSRLCLHFLYTTEYIFLVVEMFYIYSLVKDIQKIKLSSSKCLFFGWGISILLIIIVLVISGRLGYDNGCNKICWLLTNHWHIYSFMTPLGLFLLIYVVLLVVCLLELRHWKEEWRFAEKKVHLKSIAKSSSILLFLLLSCLLAVNLRSPHQGGKRFAHILFHISLVVVVFLNRCIFDKEIRFIMKRSCLGAFTRDPALKTVQSSGSFRAFMKPEKVANIVVSQEEYSVSRYYDEVNRTKYTDERKRQLSYLLGSSGASGSSNSTGDTKSTSVSGSSKESGIIEIKESGMNIDNVASDSGIYEHQDEESETDKMKSDESLRDTNIHRSIFTDPLATRKESTVSNSCAIEKDDNKDVSISIPKPEPTAIKGPEKVAAHIKDDSSQISAPSSLSDPTITFQSQNSSPRTRLKDQLQKASASPYRAKDCNGYIRNPESKLSTVFIAREGDVDYIDECSVLIHNPGENNSLGAYASSNSSKLLSSSADSSNDSPVSVD